jgi:hypothetical protein
MGVRIGVRRSGLSGVVQQRGKPASRSGYLR